MSDCVFADQSTSFSFICLLIEYCNVVWHFSKRHIFQLMWVRSCVATWSMQNQTREMNNIFAAYMCDNIELSWRLKAILLLTSEKKGYEQQQYKKKSIKNTNTHNPFIDGDCVSCVIVCVCVECNHITCVDLMAESTSTNMTFSRWLYIYVYKYKYRA